MSTLSNQGSPSSEHYPCVEVLQLILDGQATQEQCAEFEAHMDQCTNCFRNYNLEMTIKQLIRTNCCGQAPPDLIETIRNKIRQNTVL